METEKKVISKWVSNLISLFLAEGKVIEFLVSCSSEIVTIVDNGIADAYSIVIGNDTFTITEEGSETPFFQMKLDTRDQHYILFMERGSSMLEVLRLHIDSDGDKMTLDPVFDLKLEGNKLSTDHHVVDHSTQGDWRLPEWARPMQQRWSPRTSPLPPPHSEWGVPAQEDDASMKALRLSRMNEQSLANYAKQIGEIGKRVCRQDMQFNDYDKKINGLSVKMDELILKYDRILLNTIRLPSVINNSLMSVCGSEQLLDIVKTFQRPSQTIKDIGEKNITFHLFCDGEMDELIFKTLGSTTPYAAVSSALTEAAGVVTFRYIHSEIMDMTVLRHGLQKFDVNDSDMVNSVLGIFKTILQGLYNKSHVETIGFASGKDSWLTIYKKDDVERIYHYLSGVKDFLDSTSQRARSFLTY